MKVGSLFSGIGGFDLGLERAGMEIAWQVEIDPYCNKVLAKHWPNVRRYGDIKKIKEEELESVDLVCGGFPCQPFSVAGKRRGADDDRYLWPYMLRIIRYVKPRWVLGENVAGIVRMALDDCLSDLEGEGYSTGTVIIPACAVNAPHRRDRVWIAAHNECQCDESNGIGRICNETKKEVQRQIGKQWVRAEAFNGSQDVADHNPKYQQEHFGRDKLGYAFKEETFGWSDSSIRGQWSTEPDVGRVAYGIPSRVDRLKCLGNAVVPQIVEIIGRAIMEAEKTHENFGN